MSGSLILVHDHFEYRGGGEQMLLRIADLAREQGPVDLALTFGETFGTLTPQEKTRFRRIANFQFPPAMRSLAALQEHRREERRAGEWLDASPARGILAFTLRSAVRMAPLAALRNIPMAWMCQQSFPLFLAPFANAKQALGLKALLRANTQVICIASEALEAFQGLGFERKNLHLIRNGIDVEHFGRSAQRRDREALREKLGFAPGDFVVVCVARLDPIKNQKVLLEAVAEARREGAHVGAILVGGSAPHEPLYEVELHRMANSLGIGEKVSFAGEHSDTRPYLAAADAAVLPSVKEAAGLVLAEAGAAGLPLIGAKVGGIPDLVRPGETGMLFDPADPLELSDALRELAQNRDLRLELGEGARKRVREEFNASRQNALWKRFLSEFRQSVVVSAK